MSGRGKYLPNTQLYDGKYSTIQYYNKSLEDLYESLREKTLADKRKLRELEKERRREFDAHQGKLYRVCAQVWRYTFGNFGEDWLFLAALGTFVAIISYSIDQGAGMCNRARNMLFTELAERYFAKWVAWVCLPTVLILYDVGITSLIAPKAVGSGVPQIKTCLRGVYLKEFLTFRVLTAKWMGIMATLGSGMPLGKEGPLIQMSSILVTKMSKFMSSFKSVYLNENKKLELIGAAYAVGVACTFNAPIGGVLFSVEISTAYYAVRNYWRGFFAAVWGATVYRLLFVWIDGTDTIRVVFPTSFINDFPYDPLELISFAALGRFIYPAFVVLVISTVTWPPGIGQFMASSLTPRDQVVHLFSNFSWTQGNHTVAQQQVINSWTTKWSGIYTNLVVFIFYQFLASIFASSMPIPCGSFIPNFRAGAALGRIAGELMATWFPDGVRYKNKITKILPGAYATVGASAWSGAVTHTLSTSVIMFEMTSQISHVIPVLISNLIANGIARFFTPSIYDLAIQAGKLPFLPDLLPSSSAIYQICVEDFMNKNVKYIYLGMTYEELKGILKANKNIKVFPFVDNNQNMILLGSVARTELIDLVERQIGFWRRMEVVKSIEKRPEYETKNPEDQSGNEETNELKEKDEVRNRVFKKYNLNRMGFPDSSNRKKKAIREKLSEIRICDLPKQEQLEWEQKQLSEEIDFADCQVDPAPFQLVERTSLLKVHSLFSMMHLNMAYVTVIGKLIGVVGGRELRKAIDDANSGHLPMINETEEKKNCESLPLLKRG
ncbi:chloride channel protein 2-like isoform X2 [Anthonomus grandis grandis]|uniref:chloride channel protein 2-like isoform X2 n=1 Tax=Anthonomus grandis grandis TaxID=2921223 RepID=UPI0021668248|nr:chloride channel protein 2-like isoform X2 [Anthonomus grandis grandis]